MHNTTITSFTEFLKRLKIAIKNMEEINAKDTEPMFASIERQLRFVQSWTENGDRPTQEDLDRLTFGTMASRSLHEIAPILADSIYDISDFLVFWPPSVPKYRID